MDYLHVVNWKKAEELVKAGKTVTINGFPVIPLEVAAAEGVLTFVPEPKSPHGSDVTPDGKLSWSWAASSTRTPPSSASRRSRR